MHTFGNRRDIDGLRALAVIPVVLYHFGFGAFSGGLLSALARNVGGVGAHKLSGGSILIFRANQEVGNQNQRVGSLNGCGAVQVNREVTGGAPLGDGGNVDYFSGTFH